MKRTGLRRAVSGVLSVAMTASALFSDFTVPEIIYAADDTSSVETTLDGYSDSDGSITSEYIVENLDESLGEEAAALNEDAAYMVAEEYLVNELTDSSDDTDTVIDAGTVADTGTVVDTRETTETDELISVSSNDVSTSSNDVGTSTLSIDDETVSVEAEDDVDTDETTEITISNEEVAEVAETIIDTSDDIATAEDYDTNGLAPTYHYIVLNYSLVDADLIWEGITIDDLWAEAPDAFIAGYMTYVNVYTLEDNEDYYVAMIDPASLNGLSSGIYADFTDLNTDDPTVYNDIITFDAETGLVYIPKSFYFDENGEETLKELEAQVLVPYSFDITTSDVSVSVSSAIDGVEGISSTVSVPTLDVTMTIQIVDAEDADKISLDDISLTVNDDMLPYGTTDSNAYYDTETGELTISASPNYIYSVNVTIAENEAEEALAMAEQREILVASVGDLSNILVADSYYDGVEAVKADNALNMNSLSQIGVSVELEEGSIVAGQTITYTATWAVEDAQSIVSGSTMDTIIKNTAMYTYYAQNSAGSAREINDTTWSQFFDSSGNVSLSSSTDAQYLLRAIDANHMSSTYNRIVSLPDGDTLASTSYGGSTSTTTWTTNITANPSGYETFVAIHCVHNSQSAKTQSTYDDSSSVTMRVLYAYEDSNGDGYFVFALNIPKSYTQSGSSVYKVNYTTTSQTEYYAQFGIKKVSADDDTTQVGATFIYNVYEDLQSYTAAANIYMYDAYVQNIENGILTLTQVQSAFSKGSNSGTYYSATSGTSLKSLTSSNNTVIANHSDGDGYIYVTITELYAPSPYVRRDGLWLLTISPGTKEDGKVVTQSKLVSATYYYYDDSGTLQSYAEDIVSGSYTTFIAEDETTDYYGAMNLVKKSSEDGSYVGGAVYALIETGAGVSYSTYVSLAQEAYEENKTSSSAAMKAFYKKMSETDDSTETYTLETYIVGAYTTSSSGTAVQLKALNSDGSISSTSTVLEFASKTQKKYVLVEVWTPSGYTLDDSYYAFYIQNNKNTSDTYSDAATNSTIITDTSTTSTAPLHQKTGSTASSSNTWDDYASVSGNTLSAALSLTISDDDATYYAAVDMKKVDTDGEPVANAIYALVDITGLSSSTYSKLTSLAEDAYAATIVSSDVTKEYAMYKFFTNLSSAGINPTLIKGFYRTHSDGTLSALKSYTWTSSTNISINDTTDGSVILNFGSDTSRDYALVEVWTPLGYTLDDDYFAFTLKANKNETNSRAAALRASTMTTLHSNSSIAISGNTSADSSADSTYILSLTATDEEANYYGAMNLLKTSTEDDTYVGDAVYVLIETGAGISYYNYVDMATAAYEANKFDSTAAMKAFYNSMKNYSGGDLTDYIAGAYITSDDGTAVELKKVTTSGTISSTSTVLDFGTSAQKKYVLVEVWTPTGYTLDDSYYAFYLQSNRNESSTYTDAVKMTTMITDDSNTTTAPIHQTTGGTATSANTWDNYAVVTNADELTLEILLGVSDDEATYYGAMNLSKKARVEGQYVKDAVYVLIETGAGISYYNYVNMATAAYNANTTDSTAAMKAFYNSMKNYSGGDLTEYIVGAYTTTASIATLKAVNSDGTISSDNTVLNFGNKAQKKYVLVEVWTPSDYALDDSYFAFYLQSNKNESDDYDTAVNNTTMITDTSSTTTTPIHQVTGGTVTSANTWDKYATVANGSNLIAPLRLTAGNDELISHTVTKSLDSDLTESLVVSVTMELYADGDATGMTVTLDKDNDWTYTWEGLYKYDLDDDHEIKYTVKETSVEIMDDYDRTSINTVETSNVNTVFTVDIDELGGETRIGDTVKTTYLNVEKDFGIDTENVKEVIVELYRNNDPTGVKLTLNSNNNWEDTFENLVEYDPNGKAYSYKAVEVSVTYTDMWGIDRKITDRDIIKTVFTVTEVTSGKTTTITDTFNRVDHTVTKEMEGLTETLVTSVTMELFADNASLESVFGNIVLSDSNSWTGTWEGLDEYDYKGNLITYTVDEIEVTMADQFHKAIINTVPESSVKTVFDVDIEELGGETEVDNDVVITYLDVEKKFGTNTKDRISKVVVTLYRNDEAQPYTITLSDSNNWKGTFEKLVKYDPNGVEYEYRAVETSVTYTDMWGDTYTVENRTAIKNLFAVTEVTADNKTTVTNTFQFTERTVDKLFDDYTATRLVQITSRLYADGVSTYSLFGDKILKKSNNWTDTWTGYAADGTTWIGLDKYDHNGKLIDYTVEETEVIYTDKDSPVETQHIVRGGTLITIFEPVYDDDVDETTSSITNTLQTVDLTVVKEWGDYTKSHLVSIEVELWENNNPTGKIVTLSDANNWTYTWEKLDKYDSIARAYKYEAKEVSVTYTDMWGDEYTVTPSDLMFVFFDVETETEDGITTIKNTYKTTEYTVRASMKSIWTGFG